MTKEQYKKQASLSLLLVLSEAPNFIIAFALAVTTRSLVVFMDLIDSTGNLLRALFLYILVKKLGNDMESKYNYGVGKIEALSSLCLDFVLLISIACMVGVAIHDLVVPQAQSSAMWLVVIFKVFCVAGDAYVFYRQKQICSRGDNLVLKSELAMRIKNLVFDSSALVAVLLIHIFRESEFVMYFSPIVCICLAVWLIIGIAGRMRKATREILDKAADNEVRDEIIAVMDKYSDEYDKLEGVGSRISGGVSFVDIRIAFRPDATYEQITDLFKKVNYDLSLRIPDCHVSFSMTDKTLK